MKFFDKLKWRFCSLNYPTTKYADGFVRQFIDKGKLVASDQYHAFIELENCVYAVWIANYRYGWLSSCKKFNKADFNYSNANSGMYFKTVTIWDQQHPYRETIADFEEWLANKKLEAFRDYVPTAEPENVVYYSEPQEITKTKETTMSEYTFEPFEKVLCRDSVDEPWHPTFFAYINEEEDTDFPFVTVSNVYKECIPFEGNEHLVGRSNDNTVGTVEEDKIYEVYRCGTRRYETAKCIKISSEEEKGDSFIYKMDFGDDWLWCKKSQIREACKDAVDKFGKDDDKKETKFNVDDKVWFKHDNYTNAKWECATIIETDYNDKDLTYKVRLFRSGETWWANKDWLKPIDEEV